MKKTQNNLLAFVTLLILTFFASVSFASVKLPHNAAYPGGIALVPITTKSTTAPKVYYQNHRVMILNNDNKQQPWLAVVGIPLKAKAGTQYLTVKKNYGRAHTIAFNISGKKYPLRHITIKDKSKVTPGPKLAKKIRQQSKDMRALLYSWTNSQNVAYHFIAPVKGRFTSPFGLRRIYNKVKPGRHTGLDIAGATGTPIVAAARGKVIATRDYVLTGNTVFVDHGQGLITFYCHMNKIDVKAGQDVKQGEKLGTVGTTGRITGPHLHWGVSLNGVKVNPVLFLTAKANNKP